MRGALLVRGDPLAQARSLPGRDRARDPAIVDRDAAGLRELAQALAFLGLARGLEEQLAEEPERDDALLDHHDPTARDLVRERVPAVVVGIEPCGRPHEDV